VSVVIPLYNHARFIEAAVHSALGQGPHLHELILVDDGSTDGSAAVARRLAEADRRIVFWSQENRGANAGIHRSSGEFVAILNSDDVYAPQRLEILLTALDQDPTADLAASSILFLDEDGRPVSNSWYQSAMEFMERSGDLAVALVNGNVLMTTSNYVARRSLFDQIGMFAPLRYAHDLDFALRVLAEGKTIRLVREPLLHYRVHASNTIKEAPDRVRMEWAAAAAMYAVRAWDRPGTREFNWAQLAAMVEVWERHALTKSVNLCATYFRRHPTDTMERTRLFTDPLVVDHLRKAGAV
jgi:glycosyltransferase involved in cell wall biosynthesis